MVVDVGMLPKTGEKLGKRLADILDMEKVRAVPEESVALREPGSEYYGKCEYAEAGVPAASATAA